MINTILFDLDGTLLYMDQDEFAKAYFGALAEHFAHYGYDPQLILNAVIQGTKAMVVNDGKATNEETFWKTFKEISNISMEEVEQEFNDFYDIKFPQLQAATSKNTDAAACISVLKKKGYRLVLATNPLFPAVATMMRIKWAGLDPYDFDYITTYENCRTCKPNPAYYKEILTRLNLKAAQCMHVGNDVDEDGCIETLAIPCFLITDNIINAHQKELTMHWNGSFHDFARLCLEMPDVI